MKFQPISKYLLLSNAARLTFLQIKMNSLLISKFFNIHKWFKRPEMYFCKFHEIPIGASPLSVLVRASPHICTVIRPIDRAYRVTWLSCFSASSLPIKVLLLSHFNKPNAFDGGVFSMDKKMTRSWNLLFLMTLKFARWNRRNFFFFYLTKFIIKMKNVMTMMNLT